MRVFQKKNFVFETGDFRTKSFISNRKLFVKAISPTEVFGDFVDDMINLEGNRGTRYRQDFRIVSGDTVKISVEVFEESDQEAYLRNSDLSWVVKTHTDPDDGEVVFQKDNLSNGGLSVSEEIPHWLFINLEESDTSDLDGGMYVHELEERVSGEVNTLLQGKIKIESDLG